MNIFITGAAGFIGSHLSDRLIKHGHRVVGIDNFDRFYSRSIKEKNIQSAINHSLFSLVEVDIRDQKLIGSIFRDKNIDLVIHLAAKAGVRPSIKSPKEYYDVNVNGTINILDQMKECNISNLIFASSSSVYGNNEKIPFSEDDNVDFPISPYAASKKACELFCHTYSHLYNFNIFCLRFFTVYGPRQRPDLAIHKFTNNILADRPIDVYGDGSSARDYTYIDDIIDGVINAISNLEGFRIINLGESKKINLSSMIDTLEKLLNKVAIKNYLPIQEGDVSRTFADITKAKELLGYNPKWDFYSGIREFIKWKITSDSRVKSENFQ